MAALPSHLQSWASTLLFDYESTGGETLFRDLRDPHPRSRRLFAFHKPTTLVESLKKGTSLRSRLRALPALSSAGLRDCQVEAIHGIEASLRRADPRSLVQMATGAGKTFTACNLVYRLVAHAGPRAFCSWSIAKTLGSRPRPSSSDSSRPAPASSSPSCTMCNYSAAGMSTRHRAS
jgi:type I restriction enzyme R subunit